MMSDKRLRVGIIGIGNFAPFLAPYISQTMDVVAISSLGLSEDNRANFVKETGLEVQGFDNHENMMDEVELEAVFITGPNFVHLEHTLAAAERGLHVFCEKAMETTVPHCWEMVRACQKAGVRLMVGHKRRLRPPWARMIELKKNLGEVLAITDCGYFDSRPYNFPTWWRRREQSGGTLMLSGVHVIDWMRAMCGDVAEVRAVGAPQIDSSYDYPNTLHTTMTFKSGAVCTLTISIFYPPWKFRQSGGPIIVCREGGMRLVPDIDHIDLFWQHNDDKEARLERFDDLGFDHAFSLECGDFTSWVKDEHFKPCLKWEEGLRCVEVMEAAHRSAEAGGKVIKLPLYPELEPNVS